MEKARVLAAVLLVFASVAWTIWLTRAVVFGGSPDDRGAVLASVRPGEVERSADAVTGYHYRTSSRFGEYVQLRFVGDDLQISGRRLSPGTYVFFIGLISLLMASVVAAILAAPALGSWKYLLVAIGVLVAFAFASSAMAGGLWEGPGIAACAEPAGLSRVAVPTESVSDVRIGAGWARNHLGWVIWPFVGPINQLAKDHAVSFEAPDPVTGRRVVYAVHFYTADDANAFVEKIGAGR